jgi:hypothetical protein
VIEVRIPRMPPRELSPNTPIHHMAKSRVIKSVRHETYWEAREQAPYLSGKLTGPVHYTAIIGLVKGAKRMDQDNAKAMLKAFQDGLADHFSNGNDKHWVCDGVTFARDKTGPGWVTFMIDWESDEDTEG